MSNENENLLLRALTILFLLALSPIAAGAEVYFIYNLYAPAIFGLPTLTFAHSIGASFLVSLLKRRNLPEKEEKTPVELISDFLKSVIIMAMFVGLAYFVSIFIL